MALGEYRGGVILVSHDQHFIENVADEIWVVGGGAISRFGGTLQAYKKVAAAETFVPA